jgi:hypothetical protein
MEIRIDSPLVIFTGNYGSGKTEVAVNFAIDQAQRGKRVKLADLDIVNPYFRSREAAEILGEYNIAVVVPPGDLVHAENPIVLPEIRGMVEHPDELSIFDVGGDDAGATVLGSIAEIISRGSFEMIQVVNKSRPFTDTVEGCLKIQGEIERASRVKITGIVSNTHLMESTTAETIRDGYELAGAVSKQSGVFFRFVCIEESLLAAGMDLSFVHVPILPLRRYLAPPWVRGVVARGSLRRAVAQEEG